jgi:N-acetylmuramic acid 6-phosphate (MurNAc-6-P) etherase
MKAVAAGATLPAPDPTLAADDKEADWAKESAALAQSDVYVAPVADGLGPYNLAGAYTKNAQQIARQRISLAGARLANLLKTALNCSAQTCAN